MIAATDGAPVGLRGSLRRMAERCVWFAFFALRRFNDDGCFAAAGALSYTTLVSLVPLAVLALGSLSVFPNFAPVRAELLGLLFESFVPSVGEQVAFWFRNFADSATQTTAIGIAGFVVTGVLLLVTVEDQLNRIWRVTRARAWGQRVLAYWAVITLGPLLIGISLTLSTYFEVAARRTGLGERAFLLFADGWAQWLARGLPAGLEFLALGLLYWLIPNRNVRWHDAALGAFVATAAIEILKVGFSIYIGAVSYYRTVYGTLAAIPIFLLWMYISWSAVLLGAVVAAALPDWSGSGRSGSDEKGRQVGLSLALVAALARARRRGAAMTDRALAAQLGAAPEAADRLLRSLAAGGLAACTLEGGWVLLRDPETATLRDLYETLRLPLAGDWDEPVATPWQRQVAPAMARIAGAEDTVLQLTLAALIGDMPEPTAGCRRRGAETFAEEPSPE
jgi:membrane protein